MQIQISSGKNVTLHSKLSNFVESELHRTLHRFDRQLTRVEVHLSDGIGSKAGVLRDKRCTLEARPRGLPPLVVTGAAPSTQKSVSGAAEKMKRQLDATFGRLAARKFNAPQVRYSDGV
jgi:ribosome-associated translation inhibitor RaiA